MSVSLGNVAWLIERSESEMKRISDLFRSEESIAKDIFFKYAPRTKKYADAVKTQHKKIKGFRVGSPEYNSRALSLLAKDLQDGVQLPVHWVLYLNSVNDYVIAEREAFNTLMGTVELEIDKLKGNSGALSRALVEAICDNASTFGVTDEDVKTFYEIWPLDRQDDFESLVQGCPKFDPVKQLKNQMVGLSNVIEKVNAATTSALTVAELAEAEARDTRETFEKKAESLQREIQDIRSDLAKKTEDPILIRYSKQIEELPALLERQIQLEENLEQSMRNIEKFEAVADELREARLELLKFIEEENGESAWQGLSKRIEDIENWVHTASTTSPPGHSTQATPHEGEPISLLWNPFPTSPSGYVWYQLSDDNLPGPGDLDESRFIICFIQRCESAGLKYNSTELRAIHCILKNANASIVEDQELLDIWLGVMGWGGFCLKSVASPSWTSPPDWIQEQKFLLSQTAKAERSLTRTQVWELAREPRFVGGEEEPRILKLLNYDEGYVRGYLDPVLALRSHSNFVSDLARIFLFPSTPGKISCLPKAPVSHLPDFLDITIEALPKMAGDTRTPITPISAVTSELLSDWVMSTRNALAELEEPTGNQAWKIIQGMESMAIRPSREVEVEMIKLCDSLADQGISAKDTRTICLETIAKPWVTAHHGEDAADGLSTSLH